MRVVISGYRYYSSELGRWISKDPIEENGGINIYAFVQNNSINFVDLYGLFKSMQNIVYTQYPAIKRHDERVHTNNDQTPIDWQDVLEELILDQVSAKATVTGGLSIPVGAGVVNITFNGELMILRCCGDDGEEKLLNVTGEIEVRGGIGAGLGIKKYPTPKGRDRNKIGDYGKKLKHLAGQSLPWYRQRSSAGFGGLEFNSSADNSCTCPPEGWEGLLKLGIYGEVGAIISGEAKAFLEWKLGTSFNWENIDGKLEASVGLKSTVTAQVGVFGATEATWHKFIE